MPPSISGLEASARQGDPVAFSDGSYSSPWQPSGICAVAAGVVVGRLLSDSADRTYYVNPGLNSFRFKTITEAGTAGGLGLVVVRG